ncbi:type I polyketide synthase [Nucisporomicrobium flavum]|uniref:type I polyketide synthase n=1 Tax=Nucisporomicrobium flavum TaxID=2785915 RepID=UPI0018F477C5|nr:type I polyketide synthase [Nucisporomicrobium flavum]
MNRTTAEPIAVIGMGLRFPGGNTSPAGLAEFLRAGRSGIEPTPPGRWSGVEGITASGGGFLSGIDRFDALFFNTSPKEAAYVDPQQRLVLETAWEALESAGVDPATVEGDGGVYIGCSMADYASRAGELADEQLTPHLGAGLAPSAIPGRLSHFLGWHGPSMTVDSACSSSLVTLHLAATALRAGECSIALAGGVNLMHHPRNHIIFSQAGMLSPDGRCRTFDQHADGYGRSEGCGVLVLKRLADARAGGDTVLAVLTGSAVRQDGASGGLTVPNGLAQADVMRRALAAAGLAAEDVSYVEAHGTGTPLGDPIEVAAINTVFGPSRGADDPVLIASLKGNLGHMEAAAGVGGVIKTVLQLREGTIYPHIGMTTPSQHIPWRRFRVGVPTEGRDWPAGPRRGLVNSFGFAGTIASVVVEEAPDAPAPPAAGGEQLLAVSAKSAAALRRRLTDLRDFLAAHPDVPPADLAYTSTARRAHFAHRFAAAGSTTAELAAAVEAGIAEDIPAADPPEVAFLFTGQGAQYPGMGRALYRDHAVFRNRIDECDKLLEPFLDLSVRDLLLADPDEGGLEIHRTAYAQPALFVLEYALAGLWMSWGVTPGVLLGHSIGELVAATVAGLFDLPDAVRLAAERGRLMQSMSTHGGMAAVSAGRDTVLPYVDGFDEVGIAAVNSPTQCVISGRRDQLAQIIVALQRDGIRAKALAVSHAFHSPLMAQAAASFAEVAGTVTFRRPALPFVSNRTGEVARYEDVADPAYWARHILEPVDFLGGVRAVEARGRHAFIEVGPSATLTALGKQSAAAPGHLWLASVTSAADDGGGLRRAVLRGYQAGLDIDWRAYHGERRGRLTELPGYPFERKRHWLPSPQANGRAAGHGLLGTETAAAAPGVREFRSSWSATEPAWLGDHVVLGQVYFPGAGYVELVLAAQDAVFGTSDRPVFDLRIHEPLALTDEPVEVITRVRPDDGGTTTVEVLSRRPEGQGGGERGHATARLGPRGEREPAWVTELREPPGDTAGGPVLTGDRLYAEFAGLGLPYGPEFRRIESVVVGADGLARAELREVDTPPGMVLPPYALDPAVQTLLTLTEPGRTYLPRSYAEVRVFKKPKGALRSVVRLTGRDDDLAVDVLVLEGAEPVAAVRGLGLVRVANPAATRDRLSYEPQWVEQAAAATGRDRHRVLLVHPPFEAPEGHLAAADVDRAADLVWTDPDITDVAWFWWADPGATGLDRLRRESEENYTGLLRLLQEMEDLGRSRPLRLWLVTVGGQALPGDAPDDRDADALGDGSLWGFGRVLANEYPAYRVMLVDLDPAAAGPEPLLAELDAAGDDFQVAFRGGVRHVLRLRPSRTPAAEATPRLDPEATYLVTGGLGGLGRLAARRLVEAGAHRLVLAGRRPSGDQEARLSAELGADVRVVSADIADPAGVERMVEAAGPRLAGIVHAAGVLADAPISSQDWASFERVLAAKMYGGWLLHRATADLGLTFFVAYSSATALLGTAGQSNYAAANAYLDRLMHWRRAGDRAGLSVNWGPWGEVGMAARMDDQQAAQLAGRGYTPLDPEQAMAACFRALARTQPQVLVADVDWERFAATQKVPNAILAELAEHTGGTTAGVDREALLKLDPAAREEALLTIVRAQAAAVLFFDAVEDISFDARFIELGLDSMISVEFKNALETALRVPLSASLVFDHPTIRALAGYLAARLAPAGTES